MGMSRSIAGKMSDSERKVYSWLMHNGYHPQWMGIRCPFDFLVGRKRVEVKSSSYLTPVDHGEERIRHKYWRFKINRTNTGMSEEYVDIYIFCLEDVPDFKQAVYLILKAPLKVHTVSISLRSLIITWSKFIDRFDLLDEV